MSSAQFSIQLELRCSFWWLWVRRLYSLALAVAIFVVEWPLVAQVSLFLALVLAVVHVETRPEQSCTLRLESKGRLSFFSPEESAWQEAERVCADLVHPWMSVFSAKFPQGDVRHWMVLGDSCSPEDFRRLRVWLKWESGRRKTESNTA